MEPNQESKIQLKKAKDYAIKSANATIQDVDLTKRIATGFYNSNYYFDSDADVTLPGCAAKSITDRGPASNAVCKIKHLLHHDWRMLPGTIVELEERKVGDIQGIYFATKMSSTQMGTDTLINYQEKVYDNHSIGFQYMDGEYIEKGATDWNKYIQKLINPQDAEKAGFMYVWKEIRLFEGSTVAFGANALTPYLGVKSMNKESLALKINERITNLNRQVKSGTQSDEMLQSFEMEMLQLKQLINEIFAIAPSVKDTLTTGRPEKDTDGNKSKKVDFKQLLTVYN